MSEQKDRLPFTADLVKKLTEFACDVYGPLSYTSSKLKTAELPNLNKKKATDVLVNKDKNVYQLNRDELEGFKVVDSIICAAGVQGTEGYFGCILVKLSPFDIFLKNYLRLCNPKTHNVPNPVLLKSVLKFTNYYNHATLESIESFFNIYLGDNDRITFNSEWDKKKKELLTNYNYNNREIIVAFRGTKKTKDWMSNFNIFKVKSSRIGIGGKTHQGITNIYLSAQDKIIESVRKLIPASRELQRNTQIFVTGHSLGGALATVCLIDMEKLMLGPNDPICYTFASPRVGDKDFVKNFNEKFSKKQNVCYQSYCSVRFYRKNDPVPKHPAGYSHVENSVCLGEPEIIGAKTEADNAIGDGYHSMYNYRKIITSYIDYDYE
jgi:hypothetical protein